MYEELIIRGKKLILERKFRFFKGQNHPCITVVTIFGLENIMIKIYDLNHEFVNTGQFEKIILAFFNPEGTG